MERQYKQRTASLGGKSGNSLVLSLQQIGNFCCPGISNVKPDYFWRSAFGKTTLAKISILRYKDVAILLAVVPNLVVRLANQLRTSNVAASRILLA